ncbi:MAG: cation-translocating P-type ATPase [Candidatus Microthrix sp.]|nr:cation-translocating P-type ATPase [Candidatus Microthrix sp.]MBK7323187.1 cation-translocating P-type ATPase [Candidatus Microthrix sp.]
MIRLPGGLDPFAPARRLQEWLGNAEGRVHRRTSVTADHAHIEVRGIDSPDRSDMADRLKADLERLEGVNWAEIDAVVGRAVVLFDPESIEVDDLISVVEDVEDAHGAAEERFPHDRPDHPSDQEPIKRNMVALVADAAGLGVASISQALRFMPIPAEIPGVVSLIDSQPRIRRIIEDRLGRPAADMTVAATAALAQALGQGPIGLGVDMAYRASLISEQRSRQATWERRERELVQGPHSVRHRATVLPPRETPLPKGPIEQYADAASVASLGAVGLTLGLTRDPRRAADLILTGVPKAATLGREAFAAQLGVALSKSDVVVMDPAVLRRLDRVDAMVLDARLLGTERWSIDRIDQVDEDMDATSCAARVRSLLDPTQPDARRRRGSWVLAPWESDPRAPRGSVTRARRLARGGRRALGLWRSDHLVALVAVAEEPVALACELVTEARASGLDVSLAGGNDALAARLGDLVRSPATKVAGEIRAAQTDGHVVMFVSGRAHAGLRAADVGIGVETPGSKAPFGAHLLIKEGLGQGWMLLAAVRRARSVSRRSALIALAGASTGGSWALLGSGRTAAQRTMLAVNSSALLSMANGAVAGAGIGAVAPPPVPSTQPWHELDGAGVLRLVESSIDGLDDEDRAARQRAETARVERAPVGMAKAALDELANPLTPLLGVGAALSAAVGSMVDAGLVLGVVGVNTAVGAAQRVQTEHALLRLERNGQSGARVLVRGEVVDVPADSVVVGDVILLEAGDAVPGDCRLLDATALEMDESALTGESLPVQKSCDPTPGAAVAERTSMLYDGTVVAVGDATAVVVGVGSHTEAGRSAAAAGEAPPSGVEQRLGRLTRLTVPATLAAGATVTGLGFLYRRPIRQSIGTGVSLMVAAVPEGLPALATLAQVASARRLADRNALVRNPRAIEALGRVDQIWFDKTGTLTEGTISVAHLSDGFDEEPVGAAGDSLLAVLAAARRATPPTNGDAQLPHATDRAVVAAARTAGLDDADTGWERIEDLPFESARGLHATVGRQGRRHMVAVKGAPEVVLPMCGAWRRDGRESPMDAEAHRVLEDRIESMGRRGLRVLAVATADTPSRTRLTDPADLPSLTLQGFVGLLDVVRPSAAVAAGTLTEAGIRVGMITGDHPTTAQAIAVELGILNGGRVVTGVELDSLDDGELDALIDDVTVFARATPLQKVRIVAASQRAGRSVAMTGDGANDAAAIRLADAGIALGGRGTDAARANADVIVVDDRIETIVDAVVEGRAMWESVRGAVAILVGGNLGEIGFTLAGTAVGGVAPLNARQLLLVNLLTDMAPALAIALREPRDRSPETLLHAGPDASLGGALTRDIAVRAGATAAGATGAWAVASLTGTPTRARTVGLAALVGTQLGQTVVAGGTSPLVLGATVISVGALVTAIQTPGISQFFGCRPLGPVGWTTAVYASLLATGGSVAVPWAAGRAGDAIVVAHNSAQRRLQSGPGEGVVATQTIPART